MLQRQYSYDAVGNIIKLKQEKHETSYQYDALDQLTQAKPDTTAQQAEAYSYDSIGNRIGSAGQASAWQYNQLNQLSQWGEGGNQTTLSYTTDGHLASEASHNGQRHYHYNAAGRLDSISNDNNEIVHYQYDPFGRRISKTVNGETTYFIYSSEGLIAELDQTGKITKAYGWEPDTDWGTSPLWVAIPTVDQTLQNASYHYLITDHTGTPQLAVNSNGEQSWKIQSDAFGNSILDEHNQITLNLRFAGQYYDGESGLSYNYQRDYDPRTGRYIEADPIGLAGGLNTFAYAGNNPLSYIDPYGLWSLPALSEGFVNASAGFGDGILAGMSFGLIDGQAIRRWMDIDGVVDTCSIYYISGYWVGFGGTLTFSVTKIKSFKPAYFPVFFPRFRTDNLIKAANKPYNKNGITVAARAIDKHAIRPGSPFSPLKGNIQQKNAEADKIVNNILKSKSSVRKVIGKGGVEYRHPNGQGARFNKDGSFSGVLDPQWKK